MPKKYSSSDRNASRYGMPGTQAQTPDKKYSVRSADGKREIASTKMNFRGVAGGSPTAGASELKKRAKSYAKEGSTASASAASARAKNVEGHSKMTDKANQAIGKAKRKAAMEYRTTARRPKGD